MAVKKKTTGTKKARADKQRGNNAKKATSRPTGKPFAKGNPYAFKPGQSGNPAGRPKSRTLSEAYRALLSQPLPDDPTRTLADVVAAAMVQNAIAGDVAAAKELADRTEGKARQSIALSVDDRMKSVIESGVAQLVATGLTEEEARAYLNEYVPEVKQWTS
jgi:hypothetical protein